MKFTSSRLLVTSIVSFAVTQVATKDFNGFELNSCASLYQYDDIGCTGEPIAEIQMPTADKEGSSCYHDETMETPGYTFSVKDQYCSVVNGQQIFKQTVYLTTDCEGAHDTQIFGTDFCTFGLKLKSCDNTPCEDPEEQ